MSIWNAIGGLAGAWVSKREGDKNRERQDNQLQRLVADAEAAGFSPLAALGSSGGASYAAPVTTDTGSHVGNAIAGAGNAFANRHMRKLTLRKAELDNDLVKAQIDAINADTVQRATSRTNAPGAAKTSEYLDLFVRVRDPRTGQVGWGPNPDLFDAEQVAALLAWLAANPHLEAAFEGEGRDLTRGEWDALRTKDAITRTPLPRTDQPRQGRGMLGKPFGPGAWYQ